MNSTEEIKQILVWMKEKKIDIQEGTKRIQEIKKAQEKDGEIDIAQIKERVREVLCQILKIERDELNEENTFKEMGVDSISSVEIVRDLNESFKINLDGVQLYDSPTITELSISIQKELKRAILPRQNQNEKESPNVDAGRLNHRYQYMDDLVQKYSKQEEKSRGPEKSKQKLSLDKVSEPEPQIKKKAKISLEMEEEKDSSIGIGQEEKTKSETVINNELEKKIREQMQKKVVHSNECQELKEGIAIIGMSGRFPDASNTREFWRNLRDGISSIRPIPKERFSLEEHFDVDKKAQNKTYSTVAGMLYDVECFEPMFFNISPKEASVIEPQQRIFLEEAWNALEDAGCTADGMREKRCGVFVGCAPGDYSKNLEANELLTSSEAFMGMSSSILASRISYYLNLKGPAIAVDTACSSSLTAVILACRSIWDKECEMAIAGGIRLMVSPDLMIQSSQMEILSKTDQCRPFDNMADGTVLGEGAGAIILKPISKAKADKDYIYGVIRGAGMNQDGKTNGITAPSAASQIALEEEVYRKFQINPEEITFVEGHGTGTKLGDPIEVKALTKAFRNYTNKTGFCALGSVKANIGHATMAAGIASIIKVLLALKHKKIPPLLNFEEINDQIPIKTSPFYINTDLIPWPENEKHSRMAAISGFGFSGTNCHIVIEEYQG